MFLYSWNAFEEAEDYGARSVSIGSLRSLPTLFLCLSRHYSTLRLTEPFFRRRVFLVSHPSTTIPSLNPTFRAGKKHRRHSHIRLVLREIDFPTKLLEAKSINQKRKWLEYLRIARDDYEKAKVDRAELAELEALAAQLEEEARRKKEEEAKN